MASEIESSIKALSDNREGIRRFAIRRLIEIGPPAAPALIEALRQKHGFAHDSAVLALVGMGAPAIPNLIAAMNHENREVRWGVASVLNQLGDEGRAAVDSAVGASDDMQLQ
jgi:HEAT repeat protein